MLEPGAVLLCRRFLGPARHRQGVVVVRPRSIGGLVLVLIVVLVAVVWARTVQVWAMSTKRE
ncbi:hypothetical protein CF166_34820 [Amycolatopsis sp. KNN50.9b]|nr:hypothetical protein CF166_34820 [Amycolatopsis sp. KNN50.9b]